MLNIEELSYWERKTYFEEVDFLIIGAGIVGYSAALELREKYPHAKILILERGFLPSGASTKNAGFACFGSATELLDDLTRMDEDKVWSTVQKRWDGLQNLKKVIGDDALDLEVNGSWDLILPTDESQLSTINEQIPYLNEQIRLITGEENVFSEDKQSIHSFGFKDIKTSYFNRLEGQINTGKMMSRFHQLATEKDIKCLFGISVHGVQTNLYNVGIQSSAGYMKARHVLVCTNGFAQQLLPGRDVHPARAQVLVTTPIENLKVKGTFHYQQGYYYFRNVEDRILLGGGRNLDFLGETTTELETTQLITSALKHLLDTVIIPGKNYGIEYHWSGVMGVGQTKAPIVELIDPKIGIGVRMGGMGVAIGSLVGKELAEMF
ncbi:MAG: NAD(P)/FAD-dependent oxidoreductase [Flavobacteriia bacterium]|jgi:gamma-glutamylputrescine oxidase